MTQRDSAPLVQRHRTIDRTLNSTAQKKEFLAPWADNCGPKKKPPVVGEKKQSVPGREGREQCITNLAIKCVYAISMRGMARLEGVTASTAPPASPGDPCEARFDFFALG